MSLQEKARFVQVAVAMAPQQANLIYAPDDAGGVCPVGSAEGGGEVIASVPWNQANPFRARFLRACTACFGGRRGRFRHLLFWFGIRRRLGWPVA